jgi:hypothetical protein
MGRAFLSYSFRAEDRELAAQAKRILEAHGMIPVTGEGLAGRQLTDSLRDLVQSCELVVALMTQESQLPSGAYRTHTWVRDEVAFAIGQGLPVICLIHPTVEREGSLKAFVWIDLDPPACAQALVSLSSAIASNKNDRHGIRRWPRALRWVGFAAAMLLAFIAGASWSSRKFHSDDFVAARRAFAICAEQEKEFACRDEALQLEKSCPSLP